MRRFEYKDAKSEKFWEIESSVYTVRFGKIGTNGQLRTKSFDTTAACKAAADKQIAGKTKKGYIEAKGTSDLRLAKAKTAPTKLGSKAPATGR